MSGTGGRRVIRAARIAGLMAAMLVVAGAVTVGLRPGARPATAGTPVVEIHSAHGASFAPALQGKRPLFILALGSDARPGQRVDRQRADSIHLIGIDRSRTHATILGFPRDSWVHIPGFGTSKINSAMVDGGPALMVKTIESITGIRIDFWMLTSFGGLRRMVDYIGGLTVTVPYAMHDRYSGADFKAGPIHMRGWQALAFARNRHDTPNGDFSRSQNQGRLFLAALAQLGKQFPGNPAVLFTWISAGWRNVSTDLPPSTLLDLALTATQVEPGNVNNLVVPGSTGTAGGASVVFVSSSAHALYADMRKDGLAGR
jgi:polyisoprenyl-teichoic acid--peptidoglycan teichoic acid transferase